MILLTGSAGYIGSHISYILEKKKFHYIGIDNLSKSSKRNVFNKKKFLKLDFGNKHKINELLSEKSIKTIIHSAAYAYVVEGEKKKNIYYNNNVEKSKKFINECIKKNIKNFIFLSSSNVYKDNDSKKNENTKIEIKDIKNNYGKTKFIIEKYLLKKRNKFNNLIILRLFNIAAYNDDLNYIEKKNERHLRIFPLILKKIQKKQKINIFVKINKKKYIYPKRDYLHINDLLSLITKILKNINIFKKKGVYNVGMGLNYSLNKILKLISYQISEKNKKKNIKIKYKKINSKELISTLSNIKKTKKIFYWKPRNSITDIVTSCSNKLLK